MKPETGKSPGIEDSIQRSAEAAPAVQPTETLVYLVRHGETEWNVDKRFQGQGDVPLSPTGLAQADKLARWMGSLPVHFSAIYSSDLQRSMQTAMAIGRATGLRPVGVECLRELKCGEWQGLSVAEVEQRYPGQLAYWHAHIQTYCLPGGESIPDLQARVFPCFLELAARHTSQAVVVVSHGAALAALIAGLNGWDLQGTWSTRRARMGNTAISIVAVDIQTGAGRSVVINAFPHLEKPTGMESVIDPVQGSAY